MRKIDYLIVGQGIAGSLLGWELFQKGFEILIIDNGHKSSSSRIAAGLMNPITGMRLVKTWEVDKFLSFAKNYYIKIEQDLGISFFKERGILRLFKNEAEIEQWKKRKLDESYRKFLGESYESGAWNGIEGDKWGSFIIKGAGELNTPLFLKAINQHFKALSLLKEEEFDYENVELAKDSVIYKDITAKKLIFCEGYKVLENPWFNNLRWECAKGEILTVKLDRELPDNVINRGKWLVGIGEGQYRAGASYDWDQLDEIPTEKGKEEIIQEVKQILKIEDLAVIEHEGGVRPCTKDTRAYVGFHKEFKNLGVFNGLGSKGTLMGPYYARMLADHLSQGSLLESEVQLQR